MLPLSVCIIARNEEKHIAECLKRLVPYDVEIVVVDTGSTDRTVALARQYTEHIYSFPWCDDFSAAKNYAIGKAANDLILSLDCDEYLEKLDTGALFQRMAADPHAAGQILLQNRYTQNGIPCLERVWVTRLADRRYYQFTGAVHEQLEPLQGDKLVFKAPVEVLHVGYDVSDSEMEAKARRNIALLEKEIETTDSDPYLYYQLGQSYRRLKQYEKALSCFDMGLSMDVDPSLSYVQTMVESYGYTLLDLKRNQEALNLLGIYDDFCRRADFPFLIGLIYMNNGLFQQAVSEFQKAAQMKDFSVDGVNSYKAHYNTGVIYECTGNTSKAKEYYQKCGDYEPAKIRLSQL